MSKTRETAGETAKRKPLRAYVLEAIKKYSKANPGERDFARISGDALLGAMFAELVAIYCRNYCETLRSFGLMKGGVA